VDAASLLPRGAEASLEAEPATIDLPPASPRPGSTEVTMAWSTHALPAPAFPVVAGTVVNLPQIADVRSSGRRRLSREERAVFRLWKNGILFGFFVVVLLVIFWLMARK